jgi:hypothetical protein
MMLLGFVDACFAPPGVLMSQVCGITPNAAAFVTLRLVASIVQGVFGFVQGSLHARLRLFIMFRLNKFWLRVLKKKKKKKKNREKCLSSKSLKSSERQMKIAANSPILFVPLSREAPASTIRSDPHKKIETPAPQGPGLESAEPSV